MNGRGCVVEWSVQYQAAGRLARLTLRGHDLQSVLRQAAQFLVDLDKRNNNGATAPQDKEGGTWANT